MSNSNNLAFDQVNDEENESKGQPSQPQKRETGSLTNGGQGASSSIGSGSSDQGIEPGTENQEDEFRNYPNSANEWTESTMDYSTADDPALMEKDSDNRKDKGKGLVEEGPGPDS
jgi:hypothetical protein